MVRFTDRFGYGSPGVPGDGLLLRLVGFRDFWRLHDFDRGRLARADYDGFIVFVNKLGEKAQVFDRFLTKPFQGFVVEFGFLLVGVVGEAS